MDRPSTVTALLVHHYENKALALTAAQCGQLYDYIRELEDAEGEG